MNTAPQARQRGVTLIESSIVLSIAAVVVGIAAPSFEAARERRHLEGVAAQLETDLMFTRSLAVARNQTLRIDFANDKCYVVHTGPSAVCQCLPDGRSTCTGATEVLHVRQIDSSVPVVLQSNSGSIAFDAVRGTVTPTATIRAIAGNGESIRSIVNIMGRVRSCSPAPGLPGQPRC